MGDEHDTTIVVNKFRGECFGLEIGSYSRHQVSCLSLLDLCPLTDLTGMPALACDLESDRQRMHV
jgi:hypothetical protein